MKSEYLKIPTIEKLVPFPNFATVLLQHAREFPEKIALKFEDKCLTYHDLTVYCAVVDLGVEPILITFQNLTDDLPVLLACLYQGQPFNLNFDKSSRYDVKNNDGGKELEYFNPPYVKLDDQALKLNAKYDFTQYHVLLAAQAVGKTFKLFREGATYCPLTINNISDLVFGVLAPLYFCKTIEFNFDESTDHYQYAWKHQLNSKLRDAAAVFPKNAEAQGYSLLESFEQALGIGPIQTPEGEILELLGYELDKTNNKWRISGHGLSEARSQKPEARRQ